MNGDATIEHKPHNTAFKIYGVIAIILGIVIANLKPPTGLSPEAMRGLGIITTGIIFFIFRILPEFATAMGMCILFAVFNVVDAKTSFSAFTSFSTIWLLIPVLGIGSIAERSGLLKRISLGIVKVFSPNFQGTIVALLAAGTTISPAIPSVTAKSIIAAPIAKEISERLGFKDGTLASTGIFMAMFMGFVNMSPLFLTGSVMTVTCVSLLPSQYASTFSWGFWFLCMIPWGLFMLISSYFALRKLYEPKNLTTELTKSYINEKLKEMGSMSKEEKIVATVLALCLICWMTESLHGMNAGQVAGLGFLVLVALSLISKDDFRTNIPWDSIVLIGCVVGLGAVIPALKIDAYIATQLGETIASLMCNMYIFTIALAIIIYLVRFLIVEKISYLQTQ